ncbi:site-specific DNA-methyltransferase [Microbacterium sp. QXD-8]|uniref:Methyltransferase n=1 Tax=Microbacterium psychrotolerans TaxID=3068321 RepID=A0ABU0YYD2_9MICO|nr:site-specific DNA-methyltransferase [Microbacterium sp. QXD-8]MDQ7877340.1 site-specific DNA-methyltransferase [Microbacterium sp. QXD-8]
MTEIHNVAGVRLIHGNVRDAGTLADIDDGSVRTIVTSPPYFGLRDYGVEGQLGAERTVEEYVANLVEVFGHLRRVLADDGTIWLNLGDSYAAKARGSDAGWDKSRLTNPARVQKAQSAALRKTGERSRGASSGIAPKNLMGVPWRVAFAMQDAGWILRSDIVWAKPSGMPESVTDRPTRSHEYIFLFAKSPKYFYDAAAIAEESASSSIGRLTRGRSSGYGAPGQTPQTIAQPQEGRPQLRRAIELAQRAGLSDEHFEAMRAVGMGDAGKALTTQSGTGRNDARSQQLADEAKAALGGYYREFLTASTRNKRDVWTVATVPFGEAHFAVYPPELIRPCIRAGSAVGDTVLDPFSGSGTTGMVARQEGRNYIGLDLNRGYLELSLRTRFAQPVMDVWEGGAA